MWDFSRAIYAQIKIWTLQDRTLRTRESGPLISKARKSHAKKREYPPIVFSFLLLLLAAQAVKEDYHKYPKVKLA